MLTLENKVAIITGGANGIGAATAELFASLGAAVAIWDINKTAAEALAAQIGEQGGQAAAFEVDTTSLAACEAAAQAVVSRFGRISILINNAGITRDASFKKMSSEQWQQVLDVNLSGVFNSTKAVYPFMEAAEYGRIVNTSSIVALYGNFGQTNYVATKAALIGMTKVWAREFGRKGITVNAVAPGFINTAMTAAMPPEVLAGMRAKSPLQRLGEPSDIAQAYAFLASDAAAYISGTCLSVDGGAVI